MKQSLSFAMCNALASTKIGYMEVNRATSSRVNVSNTEEFQNVGAFSMIWQQSIMDISYHCIYGLVCENLYFVMIASEATITDENIRKFAFIDIMDQKMIGESPIIFSFMSEYRGEQDKPDMSVALENVNIFGLMGTAVQLFARIEDPNLPDIKFEVHVSGCKTDYTRWSDVQGMEQATRQTHTFDSSNEQYCIFPPTEAEIVYTSESDMPSDESELPTDSETGNEETDSATEEFTSDDDEGGPEPGDSSTTSGESDAKKENPLSNGAIAGIVIGVIVVLAIIAVVVVLLLLRRRKQGRESEDNSDATVEHEFDSENTVTTTATIEGLSVTESLAPSTGVFEDMSDPFDRSFEEVD